MQSVSYRAVSRHSIHKGSQFIPVKTVPLASLHRRLVVIMGTLCEYCWCPNAQFQDKLTLIANWSSSLAYQRRGEAVYFSFSQCWPEPLSHLIIHKTHFRSWIKWKHIICHFQCWCNCCQVTLISSWSCYLKCFCVFQWLLYWFDRNLLYQLSQR